MGAWALASLLLGLADPWAPYLDRPILAVEVRAPAGEDAAALRATIDISEGAWLSAAAVQEAVKRLWAVGRFGQVEVSAEVVRETVALRFDLTAQARVGAVVVAGLEGLSSGELARALRLQVGDEVSGQTHAVVRRRAAAYLARRGYPDAQVEVEQRARAEPGERTLTVRVRQGAPRRARAVAFAGAPRLPAALLRAVVGTRAGGLVDEDRLVEDRRALRALLRDHGFLLARVDAAQLRPEAGGEQVLFAVEAGPRMGLSFVGNTLLSRQELLALLPEADAGGAARMLGTLVQRIRSAYQRLGYPFAEVAVASAAPAPGARHHRLKIDEGPAAAVAQVVVCGLDAVDRQLVVDQVAAVLVEHLGEAPIFTPLSPHDRQGGGGGPWRQPAPWRARPLPARQRWVAELYREAAGHLARALVEAGYTSARVKVERPRLLGAAGTPPRAGELAAACRRRAGQRPPYAPCPLEVAFRVEQGGQAFVDSLAFAGDLAAAWEAHANAGAGGQLGALPAIVAGEGAGGVDPLPGQLPPAPLGPGQPYSAQALEDGRIRLLKSLRDGGYLYARVREAVVATTAPTSPQAPHLFDVRFDIDAGPQVSINQVLLRGNRHTRGPIIASRMTQRPGDVYSLQAALNDQHRIAELGTFRSVRVRLIDQERPGERKDVIAEVSERDRHLIEVVPGISSANGPRLASSYSHLNLGGTASRLTLGLKVNRQVFFFLYGSRGPGMAERFAGYRGIQQLTRAVDREGRIGLRSPPWSALPLDPVLRVDLVDTRINTLRYSFDSQRLIVGADGELGRRLRGTLEAHLGLTTLECNPLDPTCDQDRGLRHRQSRPLEVGRHWIAKVGPALAWEGRDSPHNPRRGLHAGGRLDLARGAQLPGGGQVAGPFAFAKLEGSLTGYLPLGRGALAVGGRVGIIPGARSRVPLEERFFLGGRGSLRGWVENSLVPMDACFVADPSEPTPAGCAGTFSASLPNPDGSGNPPLSSGGSAYLLLKAELRVPLCEQVAVAIFSDWGNLWLDPANIDPTQLRPGAGMGLRYLTPVGSLALDFGINLRRRAAPYDEALTQLHFSIGSF